MSITHTQHHHIEKWLDNWLVKGFKEEVKASSSADDLKEAATKFENYVNVMVHGNRASGGTMDGILDLDPDDPICLRCGQRFRTERELENHECPGAARVY